MKIAVVYDSLLGRGGAERMTIELANALHADIITAGHDPAIRSWLPIKGQIIDIGNVTARYSKSVSSLFEVPLRYKLTRKVKGYDLYIYSGVSAIFAAQKDCNNIWYCHTPNRTLYDLRKYRLSQTRGIKRAILKAYLQILTPADKDAAKRMVRIYANSQTVQKRVQDTYGIQAHKIYPFVDTAKFKCKRFGDFYLAVGRLYPEKRMDLIVKAFRQMLDKRLIIVGDGPQRERLQELILESANITLLSSATEKELRKLYANCIATIYTPVNEDFGLIPIESMASGKPCIAADEGGCRETVISGKTGILVRPTVDNIITGVQSIDAHKAKAMRTACEAQAKKFDRRIFVRKWKKALEDVKHH